MHTSIALLRGINVGGNNKLLMKELMKLLESLKLQNVRTYIQSGNVVFQSARKPAANLGKKIGKAIEASHGFCPSVLVISAAQLENAIVKNPFPKAVADPKTLHLFFLEKAATKADRQAIDAAKASSESVKLTKEVFYLHAPDGIARSKLAAQAEKYLGVCATARNWRTVEKLRELVESV